MVEAPTPPVQLSSLQAPTIIVEPSPGQPEWTERTVSSVPVTELQVVMA